MLGLNQIINGKYLLDYKDMLQYVRFSNILKDCGKKQLKTVLVFLLFQSLIMAITQCLIGNGIFKLFLTIKLGTSPLPPHGYPQETSFAGNSYITPKPQVDRCELHYSLDRFGMQLTISNMFHCICVKVTYLLIWALTTRLTVFGLP